MIALSGQLAAIAQVIGREFGRPSA
jgi:hypothetical protein